MYVRMYFRVMGGGGGCTVGLHVFLIHHMFMIPDSSCTVTQEP